MVAYIRELVVKRKRWISGDSFEEGVALCQSIPDATATQTAAYSGFQAGGLTGAAAAYVGFAFPALLLMVALSAVYAHAQDFHVTVSLFTGLRVIVVAIVANAAINFGQVSMRKVQDILLALFVAVFLGLGGHPIMAILLAATLALVSYRNLPSAPDRTPILPLLPSPERGCSFFRSVPS